MTHRPAPSDPQRAPSAPVGGRRASASGHQPVSAPGSGRAPLSEPVYGCGPMEALGRFYGKALRFSGYASRSEFWWAYGLIWLVRGLPALIAWGIVIWAALRLHQAEAAGLPGGWRTDEAAIGFDASALLFLGVVVIVNLALAVPTLPLVWRRCHDAGYPGTVFLISLVPFLRIVAALVLATMPTEPEKRRPEWEDRTGG